MIARQIARRLSIGGGVVGAVIMAGSPHAVAYSCSIAAYGSPVEGGVVVLQGSGFAPSEQVVVSSECFNSIELFSSSVGTLSGTVALTNRAPAGTNCVLQVAQEAECTGSFMVLGSNQAQTPVADTTAASAPGTGSDEPAPAEVLSDAETNESASSGSGKLPFTGVEIAGLLTLAGGLVGVGVVMVLTGRRRRPTT